MFNADQRGFKRAVDGRPLFFITVHPRLLFVFKLLFETKRNENWGPTLVAHRPRQESLARIALLFYMTPAPAPAPPPPPLSLFRASIFFLCHNFFTIRNEGKRLISFHCRISVDPPLFLDLSLFFLFSDGDKGLHGMAARFAWLVFAIPNNGDVIWSCATL